MKELKIIQSTLNAPKNLFNKFGNYKYRSAESIMEALKPLLAEQSCFINITDEMIMLGDRFYVKAIATISNGTESISASAFAREELTKKGMDASQITGSASSYARKYALNGLFAIDDGVDADATNRHGKEEKPASLSISQEIIDRLEGCVSVSSVAEIWNENKELQANREFVKLVTVHKNRLND